MNIKNYTLSKCRYNETATSFAAREVGCPLDHCMCGTHDSGENRHKCKVPTERDEEIAEAERAAGWDPNP